MVGTVAVLRNDKHHPAPAFTADCKHSSPLKSNAPNALAFEILSSHVKS